MAGSEGSGRDGGVSGTSERGERGEARWGSFTPNSGFCVSRSPSCQEEIRTKIRRETKGDIISGQREGQREREKREESRAKRRKGIGQASRVMVTTKGYLVSGGAPGAAVAAVAHSMGLAAALQLLLRLRQRRNGRRRIAPG